MENIEEYIDYGVVFSLSILSVSLSYFIDFSSPETLLLLAFLPLQLGFIAEISKTKFSNASLMSVFALFFVYIGGLTAVIAVITVVMSVFVSFFAGGRRFRDFYSATAIPLLLTGLIVGGITYYAISDSPQLQEQAENKIVEVSVELSSKMLANTEMEGAYDEQNESEVIKQSATNIIFLTESHVFNETSEDFNTEELRKLDSAFDSARDEVPREAVQMQESTIDDQEALMSPEERVRSIIENQMTEKHYLLLIPFATLSFYSLQPILGFLTAIFGVLFLRSRST